MNKTMENIKERIETFKEVLKDDDLIDGINTFVGKIINNGYDLSKKRMHSSVISKFDFDDDFNNRNLFDNCKKCIASTFECIFCRRDNKIFHTKDLFRVEDDQEKLNSNIDYLEEFIPMTRKELIVISKK